MSTATYDRESFEAAARPLIAWLNEHCHPHVSVHVTPVGAELSEAEMYVPVTDYLKD